MTQTLGLSLDRVRGDIYGGITASVVALPLALAFGVASGLGPIAGLYGAIFVGFFAALFGGTPAQISGPTGPMTVIMAGIVTQFGNEPLTAFFVVILAGAFQVLFGALRLGRSVTLMPYPVISGFMSGIGCIIVILQIGPLLGHDVPGGGTLGALAALSDELASPVLDALIVGLVALAIVYLTPARVQKLLPAPLIALVVGSVLVATMLGDAPVLGEIPAALPTVSLALPSLDAMPHVVGSALVLAALGAIDSLLTSLIADNISGTHHDSDRELVGQGIGNMIAGAFGGIPGAGATMRTVVNVRAGGSTRLSGMLHALVLLAVALGLGPLAGNIPHAVLAGILIKVGVDIIDWGYLRRFRTAPRAGLLFMAVVLALTVFVDLIMAVGVGLVMASLLFVKRMADLQLEAVTLVRAGEGASALSDDEAALLDATEGRVLLLTFAGPLSFGAANGFIRRISQVSGYDVMVLDFSGLTLIDSSASLAIEEIIRQAHARGRRVVLAAPRPRIAHTLERIGALDRLAREDRCADRREALARAAMLTTAPSSRASSLPSPAPSP